jgi:hypothetical protein
MSDDRKLLDRMEIYFNEQRADLEVIRLILQKFIVTLAASNPTTAEETLLRSENIGS